jgi:hypothetical protein
MSSKNPCVSSNSTTSSALTPVRVEASHRWSSTRAWERAYRLAADVEVTPLAANDRPLALFASVSADTAPDLPRPELRAMAGIRFSQPLH